MPAERALDANAVPTAGPPLDRPTIASLFTHFWQPGFMSASADELLFLQKIILERRPKTIVEIGVASGITTGFLARFLEMVGGDRVIGIDFHDFFHGDPSRPMGYMAKQVYSGPVKSDIFVKKTSLDLEAVLGDVRPEVVFIDANHHHPWPTLDMIATVPFVAPKAIIAHHDLTLFRRQTNVLGVGPKYLFDQIPPRLRSAPPEFGGNIFSILMPDNLQVIARALGTALLLPWSIPGRIAPGVFVRLRKIIETRWASPRLLGDFNRAVSIYAKR